MPLILCNRIFGRWVWRSLKWLKTNPLCLLQANLTYQFLSSWTLSWANHSQHWEKTVPKNAETSSRNGKQNKVAYWINETGNIKRSVWSLIKDPHERPGPEAMLEHRFIKERADPSQDLASWLKEVWNWSWLMSIPIPFVSFSGSPLYTLIHFPLDSFVQVFFFIPFTLIIKWKERPTKFVYSMRLFYWRVRGERLNLGLLLHDRSNITGFDDAALQLLIKRTREHIKQSGRSLTRICLFFFPICLPPLLLTYDPLEVPDSINVIVSPNP